MVYKYFYFESIESLIEELTSNVISDPEDLLLEYEQMFDDSGTVHQYHELNSGLAFQRLHEYMQKINTENDGSDFLPLPIILYSDATDTDMGRVTGSVHPIMISLGIEKYEVRKDPTTKRVIGYIPKIGKEDVANEVELPELRRKVYHQCYNAIFDNISELQRKVLAGKSTIRIKGVEKCFYPVVLFIVSDHEEKIKLLGMRRAWNTNRPCPSCLVTNVDLKKYILWGFGGAFLFTFFSLNSIDNSRIMMLLIEDRFIHYYDEHQRSRR